jgi:2-polyprenyl-3-methyl-5-hydroxy-6-metoxy-1,4-benzoquinol methylase
MSEVLYAGRDLEVLMDMRNYYNWIMKTFAPHVRGKVIEYGAGTGTFSELLAVHSERLTLVEPSANLIAPLRDRFSDSSTVDVVEATLEEHIRTIAANSIDTIVMVNVLEHVEHDEEALSRLFGALKPGGHLLVFVPALQWLMSRLDLIHGHFRRYHRPDLVSKIVAAGGEVKFCR